MSKLRLTVNEVKTRTCQVPEESVNFLGYTIGLCHSARTGRSYIGTTPSAKKIAALKAEIHELTSRRWLWTTVEDRVAKAEPEAPGLVELLLSRPGVTGLSSHRPPRAAPAPPVAARQAQGAKSRDVTVPRREAARRVRPHSAL